MTAKTKTKTRPFDVADYLDTDEVILAYVEEAMATGDPTTIVQALGAVARARGMTRVAKAAGLSRESLYKALSADGNPELATVVKVMHALGLQLAVAPAELLPSAHGPPRSKTAS